MESKYRFYLWQSCLAINQEAVTAVSSDNNKLVLEIADASSFNIAGGQLVTYEEVIDDQTIIQQGITVFADHGTNTVTLQVFYDGTPVKVINWLSIQQRTEVLLNGFYTGQYVWDRNDAQYMRKTFTGKVVLRNNPVQGNMDYNLVQEALAQDCCCTFVLDIERYCSGEWELDYQGIFTATDCTINAERCTIEFEMQPFDKYRCLLESGEPEINVLDITNVQSVDIDYSNSFEFKTCGGTVGIPPVVIPWPYPFPNFGGCIVPDPDTAVSLAGDLMDIGCIDTAENWIVYSTRFDIVTTSPAFVQVTQTFFREVKITLDVAGVPNPPPGNGWISIGGHVPILGAPSTKWVRKPYDDYYDTYNYTIGFPCDNSVTAKIIIPGQSITYDRCRSLADVLDYVAKSTCVQIEGIRSDFLDINPVGDSPDYVPGENYVTQLANEVNDLLVLQKSDFLNPTSSNAATKGLITWKKLISDICTTLNLGWYIDPSGYVRIEHLKYFDAYQLQNQIDLTAEAGNAGQRLFEYDKNNLPQTEKWEWMDSVGDDFNGYPITYDKDCTDETQAEKSTRIDNFTTDVDFMQSAPSEISQQGFVLLARNGTQVIQSTSPVSQVVMNNGPLAQVTLQPAYYKWGRILLSGIMNGEVTSFNSSIRLRKTKPLTLRGCCKTFTFDNSYAATESGNCQIARVEFSPQKNIYKFNLNPDANC